MSQAVKDTILQDFSRTPDGPLHMRLKDAEYVRSEAIVLERSSRNLYAILEGMSHVVGKADEGIVNTLKHNEQVILSAPHYHRGEVRMNARILVN